MEVGATMITRYIYDNEDILLELDGSNNIVARYTHGPGIDEPLVLEKGGASFFYHADGLGSITEITDSTGALKQQYTYSSFGKIESQLDPNFIQPYTFTGREFDSEIGLYFYRARQYEPSTGRFLQEDPVGGALLNPSSQNKYLYVGNQPLNFVDPSGRVLLVLNVGFGVVGAGISIGYDVLQGRPIDWGQAAANGLSHSIVGGGPVAKVVASGLIGLGRSLMKQLTDCNPGISITELARDFATETLTSAFSPKIPRLPFDRLAKEVKNPFNNAYLYDRLHQRLFDAQLKSVLYEIGSQGLQRGSDSFAELFR